MDFRPRGKHWHHDRFGGGKPPRRGVLRADDAEHYAIKRMAGVFSMIKKSKRELSPFMPLLPRRDHPTFLTGVAGSGTTLLGELASRYLDMAVVDEGNFEFWLADQFNQDSRLWDDLYYDQSLARLARHPYFLALYREYRPTEVVAEALKHCIEDRSPQGIGLGVLKLAANHRGQKRLGHVEPLLMDNLPKLLQVFPQCRIVHLVRDPRDVAASVVDYPWGANNVLVAAGDWNRKVREARFLGMQLGASRFLELRYEDLLQKPRDTMAALMLFTTSSVDEELLARFETEMKSSPLVQGLGIWRPQLRMQDVQFVEAAAREQMCASGYFPELPPLELSWTTYRLWKLHHRVVQLRNILSGKLALNGAGKDGPILHGPHRDTRRPLPGKE